MEFTLPQTNAEMLPFAAAGVTVFFGLIALFAPRLVMRGLGLGMLPAHPQGVAEIRSMLGGFPIGVGAMGLLLFDQPVVQLLLGVAWGIAAFGRLVSILSDGGGSLLNALLLLVQLALAALPLAAAFGFVGA